MSDLEPSPREASRRTPCRLDVGERLFVWGFRALAQHHRRGSPSFAELQEVFEHFGVDGAVSPLDAVMDAFYRTAHTAIEVHGPACPCVSMDEIFLLRGFAAAQSGDLETVRGQFERWLPELAADWVLAPMCGLARLFQTAGYTLPRHHDRQASTDPTRAIRTWPIGSQALH